MLKNEIAVMLLSFFLYQNVFAQQNQELKIGDLMPDCTFKLINAPENQVNLSDYNDGLVIIDIWGINCPGCIADLPQRESLQKQFGSKIKIFALCKGEAYRGGKEDDVKKFWRENRHTKGLKLLPVIVEDTVILRQISSTYFYPQIWIYKGKLIGVTDAEFVDAATIQKVLEGKTPGWPIWTQVPVMNPETTPLFAIDPHQIVNQATPVTYSAVSDYKQGLQVHGITAGQNIVRDSGNKTVRTYFLNQSIFFSYLQTWLKTIPFEEWDKIRMPSYRSPNICVWQVYDKTQYQYFDEAESVHYQEWLQKNAICFESVAPDKGQSDADTYKSVMADLNRLLGLDFRMQRRKEKVLLLVRTTKDDSKFKSKRKPILEKKFSDDAFEVEKKGTVTDYRGIVFAEIVNRLNGTSENPYVYDETNYNGKVDLILDIPSWNNIPAVRKALKPYGLDLREEVREVDKLIFTEVEGGRIINTKMQREAKEKRQLQKDLRIPTVEENSSFLDKNKKQAGIVTLPSGLQYKVIEQGSGAKPSANSKVIVHYTGTLVNGKIFESSKENGIASVFYLNEVIKGWTEALRLMPVGSKWILYVPAELAYGTHTNSGSIPANSVLIFEIELLSISK